MSLVPVPAPFAKAGFTAKGRMRKDKFSAQGQAPPPACMRAGFDRDVAERHSVSKHLFKLLNPIPSMKGFNGKSENSTPIGMF